MVFKIYFCGSIRGGRDDAALYGRIVEELKKYGKVLTEHVASESMIAHDLESKDPKSIHDLDIELLEESDVLVAEVTQPSLGVGYEIGRAVTMGKPILCLFRPESGKYLSPMIEGAVDGKDIVCKNYQVKEVYTIIKNFLGLYKKDLVENSDR